MRLYFKKMIGFFVVAVILVTMCGFSSGKDEINSSVIEKLVGDYYSTVYDSFINLEISDFSDIMDLSDVHAKNRITNIKNSILREKYVEDNKLSDAHFSRYNYSFVIDKITLADKNTLDVTVILSMDSDPLHVYPYLFNPGENNFLVSITSNGLKIIDHQFSFIEVFEEISDCEIEYNPAKIIEEFASLFDCCSTVEAVCEDDLIEANNSSPIITAYPYTSYSYNTSRAVSYATNYCTNGNPFFYTATYDCTNFVSQCIAYGFGSTTPYSSSSSYRMTGGSYSTGWFGGSGGGSAAWESVGNNWTYMISAKTNDSGPRVVQTNASNITNGTIMQVDFSTADGIYDHSTICINATSLVFAQHSPNKTNYLSSYSGNKRFYKPNTFRVY